jgi:hypothetical protein
VNNLLAPKSPSVPRPVAAGKPSLADFRATSAKPYCLTTLQNVYALLHELICETEWEAYESKDLENQILKVYQVRGKSAQRYIETMHDIMAYFQRKGILDETTELHREQIKKIVWSTIAEKQPALTAHAWRVGEITAEWAFHFFEEAGTFEYEEFPQAIDKKSREAGIDLTCVYAIAANVYDFMHEKGYWG